MNCELDSCLLPTLHQKVVEEDFPPLASKLSDEAMARVQTVPAGNGEKLVLVWTKAFD